MNTVYMDRQITAKIVTPLYEEVKDVARERGQNMSEYLRYLIIEDIQRRK